MTLADVLTALSTCGALKKSRVPAMKTSLKYLAEALGHASPAQCPADAACLQEATWAKALEATRHAGDAGTDHLCEYTAQRAIIFASLRAAEAHGLHAGPPPAPAPPPPPPRLSWCSTRAPPTRPPIAPISAAATGYPGRRGPPISRLAGRPTWRSVTCVCGLTTLDHDGALSGALPGLHHAHCRPHTDLGRRLQHSRDPRLCALAWHTGGPPGQCLWLGWSRVNSPPSRWRSSTPKPAPWPTFATTSRRPLPLHQKAPAHRLESSRKATHGGGCLPPTAGRLPNVIARDRQACRNGLYRHQSVPKGGSSSNSWYQDPLTPAERARAAPGGPSLRRILSTGALAPPPRGQRSQGRPMRGAQPHTLPRGSHGASP